MNTARDHGGDLDTAIARHGGSGADWLDLSTGINPVPYPVDGLDLSAWTRLPGQHDRDRLIAMARSFWKVPEGVAVVPVPGLSAIIPRLPELSWAGRVHIPSPTYNEYAASWRLAGQLYEHEPDAPVRVFVHPNNPDGQLWSRRVVHGEHRELTIVDESFCDTCPDQSHVGDTVEPGILVLKSFGKFWGLAGLRLGFAIGTPHTLSRPGHGAQEPVDLAEMIGPWAVSGPALEIGTRALSDHRWATESRSRLKRDAKRLDQTMRAAGADLVGGTSLFRLYQVDDAASWQERLGRHHVHSRTFPYSRTWLRLGLPPPDRWEQLEAALGAPGGARTKPSGAPSR